MSPSALRRRALLSCTMLAAAAVSYGRRAYGACAVSVAPNYQCSGANATTQTITANNASVSTVAGFSVNTAGDAITIGGDGAMSYSDTNASPLTAAAGDDLRVTSADNFASTPGSVTINTTGALSGGTAGIDGRNYGSGSLTITTNGNVTGTAAYGILASTIGAGLSVTTAAGTTVSGRYGIYTRNDGTGALTITANGDTTGTLAHGIFALNHGTALSVTTGTTVSGYRTGIFARSYGGALTITANGSVTGTTVNGIYAENLGTSTALSVTTGAGTVSGSTNGISARNYGTGALTIAANGNVTGTTSNGINAYNSHAATNLTVTTAASTTVSGGTDGIYARNQGSGALAITVAATGTVSGTGGFGIQALGSPATVTVAGTVNGGAGGAITFDQATGFANRLELVTGAVINGNVLGGTGTDTLGLSGSGSGSFNVAQFVSFEAGQKTGSGSWTLTGANPGITAFSVGAGTLLVNGSLGNAAFAVSGGTLGGTGSVGNTLISGGTFAPGSGTPGTSMTVNGTLGLNAAATYAVNLNPATASFANVSGAATLGGATVNAIFANGSYISRQYTILTAGSVSASFGTLANTNLPTNFTDALSYDATHAYLNLTLSFIPPSAPDFGSGLNVNQNNVGNALINFFNSTGGIPTVFGTLTPAGLTQLSGESATSSQQTTFNAMGLFMGLLTDPFITGRGDRISGGGRPNAYADDNMAYAARRKGRSTSERDAYDTVYTKAPPLAPSFAQRWSVWAAGYGGSQTTDGNSVVGSNDTRGSIYGTAVGADYRFSPNTIAGFALAGGGTNFSVNGLGTGRSDLFQAGAFVRHNVGAAYLAGALAYGWQDISTDRIVTVAGIDRLRAQFNANAWSGRVEGGYRFVSSWIGGIGITPYAAGQFTTFELPNYAEGAVSGANTFALAYSAKSVTAPRSEIGVRTDTSWTMQNAILTLRGRLAWAHDFNPDRAIGATFQALPGASFVVNGARQASDSALTTASAEMKWMNGWSAAATFEGEFSNVTRSYAGKGVVRYAW